MDAYQVQGHGLDTLRRVRLPDPVPGPGEVLLRVRAVSLNYRDYALVAGRYLPQLPRPYIPVSDGVGTVEAVGAGVDALAPGQRILGVYASDWCDGPFRSAYHASKLGGQRPGWLAQWIVLPQHAVVPAPADLDDAQAATLPASALTAWTALRRLALRPGERLLVQGTGSVSLMALQLAVAAGCEVIATTGGTAKAALLRRMGAHAVIDYRACGDMAAAIRACTGGHGVDGVVEVVGGQGLLDLLGAVADNGRVAVVGFLDSPVLSGDLIGPMLARQIALFGISAGSRADFIGLLADLERYRIVPLVGEQFEFGQADRAFAALAGPRPAGKPVVRVG
ncbi:NAD(P)-dependent alcohol dehydrogenase [Stenotrophomonas sp. MMGLT7]|uniref:zinc-dependent alcohol dehydrogenase family protein n=1 Tax=Stenotrophomonas sp. MMGLT7 TaxID=2901227 RepID=UPI001E2E1383|nr:NAD(P)-dependent alcohol dehydrogenase [Stenotrophomonas sp. MMGLT7]MCD7097885.1 NAD(P)-dependent alcohol dehydrogenase [Stenotrophomonas sp. MMGLT7]